MSALLINPLFQLKIRPQFRAKSHAKSFTVSVSARIDNSQSTKNQQQELNLSVLRFTFGIPGLDESYLPRWIGYGFGSLLLLNHFLGSNSAITPPQLRTEALGLSLAAFSIGLPYFGRFLKGATQLDKADVPEDSEHIFLLSESISDTKKEDMAWASYVLLRNTKAISVLISIQGELCVRGYWNCPKNLSKTHVIDWFKGEIENIGLVDLKDTLYFPQTTESGFWGMLSRGTRSLMVEPVRQARQQSDKEMDQTNGFIMLASSSGYAFSDKDRGWVRAIANKFGV